MSERAAVPDVTVVVAVYNTMPYLTQCLDSLVAQTIGHGSMQVVVVDDGSTDGGAEEVDRYAARWPEVFEVVHQENSGSPAAPNNRALEVARGRFVFFLGADDHLGEEALQRLVATADEHHADVVFGRMVGTNDRFVHQRIYRETDLDLDLYDSELPFAVANTKLFRRSLVEGLGLRFPEDLLIGSDQPFTIAALVHSRRTCVLADYTFYYAVKRDDASNISYHSTWRDRLWCTGRIMDEVAGHVPEGPRRDAVLRRHLTWEVAKLLRLDLLDLPADERAELVEGVGLLCDRYFTAALRRRIGVKRRVRLCLAQARRLDLVEQLLAYEAAHGDPPFVADGDRAFAAYPGFTGDDGAARAWYELFAESVTGRLRGSTYCTVLETTRGGVRVGGTLPVVPAAAVAGLHLREVDKPVSGRSRKAALAADLPGAEPVHTTTRVVDDPERGPMTAFEAVVDPSRLLARRGHLAVRLRVDLGDWSYDLPVPGTLAGASTPTVVGRRLRRTRTVLTADDDGALVVEARPLWPRSPLDALRRLARRP